MNERKCKQQSAAAQTNSRSPVQKIAKANNLIEIS
jgi:hypothetical protein